MARPKKDSVDYFPHYVNHGKTVKIIQNLYGNDGYAFFYKLLEVLGKTHGHYYVCQKVEDQEFLASETHLNWGFCDRILQKLSDMTIIDQKLWENGVIWMQSFVDSIKDAYKKRGVSVPEIPHIAGFLVPEIPQAECVSGADNPQSKVKESITPLPPLDNSPPKKTPKPKRVKVSVDYDSEIEKAYNLFSPDLKIPVQALIAVVASVNKTEKISQARELSLLGELGDVSATTTTDIFRYAILEAADKKVVNMGYIKAIVKRKQAEANTNGAENGYRSEGEHLPRPAPKLRFFENRDGTFTRVDPCGDERRVTRAEMDAELKVVAPQLNEAQKFIGAIAGAM